ncbi:MAG: riboflavin biosynthesis protein RibF [Opitutaceae bacterium]|nr:riboflavin biosynthesis protein RibF [Opitutaceae bacterium]
MFDGVHRGHQAVVKSAIDAARRHGGTSAVLTFWPHPSVLFKPDNPVRQLQTPEFRERLLFSLDLDAVITQPFTREFASIKAEQFLSTLKGWLPLLAAVFVGDNWRFGNGRSGDVPFLQAEGKRLGIEVVSILRLQAEGEVVSSSRIRALLAEGDITGANALLGYAYFCEGVVTPGKRLGRTLGFPTLNLAWSPDLAPRFGSYVTRVRSILEDDEPWLPAVANYGLRPTVEQSSKPLLEVHVIGNCNLDAGDRICVEWLSFLRPERRFADVNELKSQINADLESARAYFRSRDA